MNDNELLLALSEMMDKKLSVQLGPIKSDITEVKGDIANLKTDMVEVKGDIANLKTDMVEVKGDIANLKTDMVEVKGDIANLKTDMVEVKGDIATLKTDMVEMKGDIANLKTDMIEVKSDIAGLKIEVQKTNVILENEISPAIKLLAENYLPAAIRYESSNKEHEEMKADIELLKKVVAEHSEKLQKIS